MPKGRSGNRHVLVTAGHTTYLGGGKRTYKRVGGKVSKKGAYKKAQKKNFMNKRAAVVETKRKTYEDFRSPGYFSGDATADASALIAFPDRTVWITTAQEHVSLNPETYLMWSQGLSQPQHIGQSVTVKHLNMKIQVRFPQPHMKIAGTPQQIPQLPQKYELVWGWVPAPLNLTGLTTPPANTETIAAIRSYINLRVNDYFNHRKDKLRFIPKKDSTLRIVGRKKVRPDMRHTSTAPPQTTDATVGADTVVGTIPDYDTEITWKMPNGAKKLWLEQTGNVDGGSHVIGMYPNYSWLPFCVFVNWNYDEIVESHPGQEIHYVPSIAMNDIVYFTDS